MAKYKRLLPLGLYFFVLVLINRSALKDQKIDITITLQTSALYFLIFSAFITEFVSPGITKYLLWPITLLVFYSARLITPFYFMDDWYHWLAITRGSFFEALFIPFVDHVAPVWRFVQMINKQIFGPFGAMLTLPYLGILNVSLAALAVYKTLKLLKINNAYLYASIFLLYPGYKSIIFWMSTNAIALSAVFGVAALYLQEKRILKDQNTKGDDAKIFVLLTLSCFTWTTAIVFPLACILRYYWIRLIHKDTVRIKTVPLGSVLALACFLLTRYFIIRNFNYTDESKLLWTNGGLTHGNSLNLLRPLIWPFMSVWHSFVLNGIFEIPFKEDAFWQYTAEGLAVFLGVTLLVYFKKGDQNLLFAYLFAFLNFAVVFVGRGTKGLTHYTPHGYLDYALRNEWYRITACAGIIFYSSLFLNKFSPINMRRILLFFIAGFFCLNAYDTKYFMYKIFVGDQKSDWLKFKACLPKANLSQPELIFASRYLYLPLKGSNPGNYWLKYEPSWFDLLISKKDDLWQRGTVDYNPKLLEDLASRINAQCDTRLATDEEYLKSFSWQRFPPSNPRVEVEKLPLSKANYWKYSLGDGCPLTKYQFIEIAVDTAVPLPADTRKVWINDMPILLPQRLETRPIRTVLIDIRAWPAIRRCSANIEISLRTQSPIRQQFISRVALIKPPMYNFDVATDRSSIDLE